MLYDFIECPSDFTSSKMGKVALDKNGKVTVDTLAALRLRLYWHKARYAMAQVICFFKISLF